MFLFTINIVVFIYYNIADMRTEEFNLEWKNH